MVLAILIILLLALTLYAVLGGADFGAGVWEFNTAFKASERERDLLYHAIGPVWETNHVWLIFVMVIHAWAWMRIRHIAGKVKTLKPDFWKWQVGFTAVTSRILP